MNPIRIRVVPMQCTLPPTVTAQPPPASSKTSTYVRTYVRYEGSACSTCYANTAKHAHRANSGAVKSVQGTRRRASGAVKEDEQGHPTASPWSAFLVFAFLRPALLCLALLRPTSLNPTSPRRVNSPAQSQKPPQQPTTSPSTAPGRTAKTSWYVACKSQLVPYMPYGTLTSTQ